MERSENIKILQEYKNEFKDKLKETNKMKAFSLRHSLKTIPEPNKKEYLLRLTESKEKLGNRMLWKIWHAKNPGSKDSINTYGFKTPNHPPVDDDLKPFFNDLFGLIPMIKFRPGNNKYQQELKRDVNRIKECEDILVKADKTENIYQVPAKEYSKKLTEELTKEYRKVNRTELDKVNKEAARLCSKLEIADRVEKFSEAEPFYTLKDHKDNFNTKPSIRLINPAISQVGKISKKILEKANKIIREKTGSMQWTSSSQPVEWFKNINDKQKCRFIKYDVDAFYPSISVELFKKSIKYARKFTEITKIDEEILWQARKGFVIKDGEVWIKKTGEKFDVSMGSPDGAEVAEFVGLYLLSLVNKEFPDSGLYRDDGAGVVRLSGPQTTKLVKKLHKIFNGEGLKITVEANLKTIDYLDFEMNLETGIVKPWRKPNSKPKYINVSSCHPNANIKSLPGMIQNRLSSLSSTAKQFEEVVDPYNEALQAAGYKDVKLEYQEPKQAKRRRSRLVTWFNPPFSTNVSTNLTKAFNNIISKHFKRDTLLGKLFNKNNLKLSYSTMPNLNQIISGHNKKLLKKKEPEQTVKLCNCKVGVENCILEGKCLTKDIVYEAKINAENKDDKFYLGLTATTFKERHKNHKSDFKLAHRRYSTKLSGYIWNLKDEGITNYNISFKVKQPAQSYSTTAGKCRLCLTEKLLIMQSDPKVYLNQNSEILAKCRHRNKFMLSNLK